MGYLLDNQQTQAGVRFGALAELFDPPTFRRLDALGVGPGWRCWEVGAGARTSTGPSRSWRTGCVAGSGR